MFATGRAGAVRGLAVALALAGASSAHAAAQEAQQAGRVEGVVTETGAALPIAGAEIRIQGTSLNAITNAEGRFQLADVPAGTHTLTVQMLGYGQLTREVEVTAGGVATLTIEVELEAVQLDELVVTALGVERARRAVPYAVVEVRADEIAQAAPVTVATALYGKAAGVAVSGGATGPTGGMNISVRGAKSITGDNRPLIIVDGIPIHDEDSGYSEVPWEYNRDLGTGINNINPQDIESIQVLKGAGAAALYGAQAANGVVLIQTKRGGATGGGMGVEVRSSVMFDRVAVLPDFQNEFGAGIGYLSLEDLENDGSFPLDEDGTPYVVPSSNSFGPRMEGQMVRWFDGEIRPFEPQPDNFRELYDAGHTIVNSVSMSNVTDRARYRLGFTRNDWHGVSPGSEQQRNTLTLTGDLNISDRLTTELSLNYYNTSTLNPPAKWYFAYNFPRSTRTDLLREMYKTEDGYMIAEDAYPNLHTGDRRMARDIFWTGYEKEYDASEDQLLGSLAARYQFTDWMNLKLRVGSDLTNRSIEIREPNEMPNTEGNSGRYGVQEREDRIDYGDLLLGINRQLTADVGLDLLLGAATQRTRASESTIDTQDGLVRENWFSISNSRTEANETAWRGRERTDGVFANAQFSLRDYLFLNASGRNDWTSTLPPENNSYFYPAIGASFVLSDAVRLPDFITYAQLRANYAQVGRGAKRYQANRVYIFEPWEGVTTNRFDPIVPPENLKPERKHDYEFGFNVGVLNNRVNLDASFYHERNVDQIIDLEVAHSAGARAVTVNNGIMTNTGIELSLDARPIVTRDFDWSTTFNFARNRNEVVSLAEGIEQIVLQNMEDNLFVVAQPGRPFGEILGFDHRYAPDGSRIVDGGGLYAKSDTLSMVGNISPDWTGGLLNTFRYKNLSLTTVIDVRVGGDIIGMSNYFGYATGKLEETLRGRSEEHGGLPYYVDDNGDWVQLGSHSEEAPGGRTVYHDGIILDGVKEMFDADGNVIGYEENDQLVPVWEYYSTNYEWKGQGIYPSIVYDNSFVKLRELVLSYRLPGTFAQRLGVQDLELSLIGRNLAFLYKNVPHLDPESSLGSSARLQGVNHYEAYHPSTRSIGLSLRARF